MASSKLVVSGWATIALLATLLFAAPVSAAPVEYGYRDFSYSASGVSAPTGQKPQSKLFFNDGSWWGVLFSTNSDAYNIYELNNATQEWSDTGVIVEPRNSTQYDVLFDGTSLYVASGYKTASNPGPTEIRRFSYAPATRTYSLDAGFPSTIVTGGMESGVIDKDTTGALWFTYTRSNSVWVTRSTTDDATWGAPFVIPVPGTSNLESEDQSAVVSYDGKIGVMWSNQTDEAMYFASHNDGDPDSTWTANPAVTLPEYADDHLNLKSIQASNDGRVFAATKTSLNNGSAPLILLLELKQNGTWKRHTVSRVSDNQTRPIVMIDEENLRVYVFASGPCCSGGTVYYKDAPLSNISFPTGQGNIFIQSSQDPKVNNITSTKQPLSSATGLVAIAGDDSTKYYLHNSLSLGPDTTPPNTIFNSTPQNPSGPAEATFEFSSSEGGSTFECRLDLGSWAACSSPWSDPAISLGTHTFEARATDVAGNTDPTPASYTWDVVPTTSLTFTPVADSWIDESAPTANHGSDTNIDVDGGTTSNEGLVKFDIAGVAGTISSATMRMWVTNGTSNGPIIQTSDSSWLENTVTWNSRPTPSGVTLANIGSVSSDNFLDVDVTPAITGNGTVSLSLIPESSDGYEFDSREATTPAELTVVFESGPDMTPPDTSIDSGPPPLTNATDATFTFSSTETGSTFECRVDAGSWSACTTPHVVTGLSTGGHTFDVRATDAAGNTDLTPATYSWTIDSTAPTVTSTLPSDGAADVPVETDVDVAFSEAMDAATITSASIQLSPAAGGPVSASVSYDGGSQTATLTPSSPLTPQTQYTIDVQGATDAAGNAVVPSSSSFTTGDAPSSLTFSPNADAYARATNPTTNYGIASTLISDGGGSAKDVFLRFDVAGVGPTIDTATLRVYVTNGSNNGPEVALADSNWVESTLNWNNRPALISSVFADVGSVSAGGYLDIDVTPAITGAGTYTFSLTSISSNATKFNSKEAASNPPELIVSSSSGPDTTPPDTTITSSPPSTTNSTDATFEFSSLEPGVTFECNLDGQGWSSCTSPTSYTSLAVGQHDFEVRATDAAGNTDPTPATWNWEILSGSTLVFMPEADSYVEEAKPDRNRGSASTLISDGGNGVDKEISMRFGVAGVTGTVASATLRVWVTNGSSNGPEVFSSAPGWNETTVTWNTKPALTSPAWDDATSVSAGTWHEFDVTGAIGGDGTYSFTMLSVSTDAMKIHSREAANPPQLVIDTA